jgi:hypothetical protein
MVGTFVLYIRAFSNSYFSFWPNTYKEYNAEQCIPYTGI